MPIAPDRLRILHYPHPALRRRCEPVTRFDAELEAVARRMLELMHAAPGVGLAAPQVGLDWRLFVANPTGEAGDDRIYVNPALSDPTPETGDEEEGCLSLPEVNIVQRRPVGITIRAQDLAGSAFEERSLELPARIWQHEYDHLEGRLIIDRMSPVERAANRRALRALEAKG